MPWETPPHTILSGNTAGTTNIHGPVVTLVGGANITLSGSGQQIVIKGGAGGAGGTGPSIQAGTQSTDGGTVVFSNANNVTFGMTNSSRITASASFPAQTQFVLSASNGLNWGTNGSTVTGSYTVPETSAFLTTARASTDAIGLNTAKSNVTWTVNSSGLSFDARGYAGTGTAVTNAGLTVNSGGVSVSVGPFITTARGSTDAVGLNTAQTNVTWTVNSSGLSLNAGGYAGTATAVTSCAVTANSAGISVSVGPYITTARASTDAIGLNTAQSNVTWTANSSGLSLDARGYAGTATGATNATITANSAGVSVNVGNYITTARASTDAIGLNTAQTNVTWTANSSGLSLNAGGYAGTVSGATNCSVTANTAGVSVSVVAPVVSYWENPRVDGLASWSGTSNSISVQRIIIPLQISATRADFILNISGSSSGALSLRVNLGLYTGANSTLNSASTTSRGFTFQSTSGQSYTNWSGPRSVSIALGTWNMTPGEYFLAANFGWTTASTNTVSLNMYGNSSFVVSGAESGALGNFTNFFRSGMINNNAQSTLPNTMQLSGMTQTGAAAAQQPWFGFHGTF